VLFVSFHVRLKENTERLDRVVRLMENENEIVRATLLEISDSDKEIYILNEKVRNQATSLSAIHDKFKMIDEIQKRVNNFSTALELLRTRYDLEIQKLKREVEP
jgi:septation ring formation regulator EzrA